MTEKDMSNKYFIKEDPEDFSEATFIMLKSIASKLTKIPGNNTQSHRL